MSCNLQNAKRKRPLHDSDDDLPAIHLKQETPAGPEARQESEYGTDSEGCALSLMMLSVGLTIADLPLPSYASEYTKNSVRQKQTCWRGLIELLLKEFSAETPETRQDEVQRLRRSFIRKAESLSEAQSVSSSGSSLTHVTNSQMEIPLDGVDPDATEPEDDIWDDSDGGEGVDATEPNLQSENGLQGEAEPRTETGDM